MPFDGTWFVLLDKLLSDWTSKAVTLTLNVDSISSGGGSGISVGVWVALGLVAVVIVGFVAYGSSESQKRHKQSATVQPK